MTYQNKSRSAHGPVFTSDMVRMNDIVIGFTCRVLRVEIQQAASHALHLYR